jgi:isoaspartyl peptidase/L-asparaginase-like protein (Ntn-hydrolase superfamily)
MRNGASPQEACRLAIVRIIYKLPQYKDRNDFLAGFIALRKDGEVGACSYGKGLQYTLHKNGVSKLSMPSIWRNRT